MPDSTKPDEDDSQTKELREEMNRLITQSLTAKYKSQFKTKQPKTYYKYNYKISKGKFYISVMTTSSKYNLDLRVRLYSVGTEIVSTEADDSIKEVKGALESVRHEQVC